MFQAGTTNCKHVKSRLFQYYDNSFYHHLMRKKLYLFNIQTVTEQNNSLSQCQFKKTGGKNIVLPEVKFRVVNCKQTRKMFIMCQIFIGKKKSKSVDNFYVS